MYYNRRGVAPYDLIQRDFKILDAAEKFRTTWDVERLVLMQSVQGHAHEGHATFRGRSYPNTTIDDISRALRLDPVWVREERQRLIDEIAAYADKVMAGEEDAPLLNDDGAGFLGSSMFRDLQVSGPDVLRGLYLGGLRDDSDIRFQMESKYGITIGGGKCYLVDTKVMDRLDLDGDILAHGSHEDMILYYRDTGLIAADSGKDAGNLEYMYIRHRRGLGASDDTAIVAAGLLYGLGVAVGVFLADAIDTLEKHVPLFFDQDNQLARKIEKGYPDLGMGEAEVRHLAYLSAIPEDSGVPVPDSSLRHLMLIDGKHDMTAIESHLCFIQNKHLPSVRIGHEEVLNHQFYQYVKDRLQHSPGVLYGD
jgi:hypothetical protein